MKCEECGCDHPCPGQWEPGCDLGQNIDHAVRASPETEAAVNKIVEGWKNARISPQSVGCHCDTCSMGNCPGATDSKALTAPE